MTAKMKTRLELSLNSRLFQASLRHWKDVIDVAGFWLVHSSAPLFKTSVVRTKGKSEIGNQNIRKMKL